MPKSAVAMRGEVRSSCFALGKDLEKICGPAESAECLHGFKRYQLHELRGCL